MDGEYTYGSITDKIADLVLERRSGRLFWIALGITGALTVLFHVVVPDDALIRLRQRAGGQAWCLA